MNALKENSMDFGVHMRLAWMFLALLVAGSGHALAQTVAGATRLGAVQTVAEPDLSSAVYGDWVVQCRAVSVSGLPPRLCEVTQTLKTTVHAGDNAQPQTLNLGLLAVGRVRENESYSVTAMLPLDVGFPSKVNLNLMVEGNALLDDLSLNWSRCIPSGCYATVTLADDQLKRLLQTTGQARLQWQTSSGQVLRLPVSLKGLATAFKQL